MTALSRRAFLGRSAAALAGTVLPIPKAFALVPQNAPTLRWFAVGDEEYVYPYLAPSLESALRSHAIEFDRTVGEDCPECGEFNCTIHNDDLDAPLPYLEDHSFEFAGDIPPDRQPSKADWLDNGVNVDCDHCDLGEPDECQMYFGEALCWDCLEVARIRRLDGIVGTPEGTPMFQRWGGR